MKYLHFVLILCSFVLAPSLFAHECETSCSQRCVSTVAEFERVVQANHDYCDGGQETCVLNCTAHYSDGTCRTYGPDYCGRHPVCVANCSARYTDGTCRTYDADACGEQPLNCVANCTARYTDGSCRDYGADHCGRNAACRQNCIERYSDGSCRTYGGDICIP